MLPAYRASHIINVFISFVSDRCFSQSSVSKHDLLFCYRMAPEVIACDEQPDATYDNRV